MDFAKITPGEWVIVFATLLGPILAVQAQRFIDLLRERRKAKLWVFQTLMTTRATPLHYEHVKALNHIDLTFYGTRLFGHHWQSASERRVTDAWKVLLDNFAPDGTLSEAQLEFHYAKRPELLTDMLAKIGKDVGFDFDPVHIRKAGYVPVAHDQEVRDQETLRKAFIELISGRQSLKMQVVSFPVNEQAAATHRTMIEQLVEASRSGELVVRIREGSAPV
jgi:hypothetical protein